MARNTTISTKPNQPRRRNSMAHSHRKNNSMSNRMNRIATVENLIGKRPSLTAMGSLPHSNGSSFTGVSRLGAMRAGMPSSAPATPAAKRNVRKIGRYSMFIVAGSARPARLSGGGGEGPCFGGRAGGGGGGPRNRRGRPLVAPAVPRQPVKPRYRLRVVIEDVGAGIDDGLQRGRVALEVRDQHLDA